jgi:hypothetical protein
VQQGGYRFSGFLVSYELAGVLLQVELARCQATAGKTARRGRL